LQLLYLRLENQNQGDKMEKLDKIQDVKVGEQEIEIDPRSKDTANKAYNYIGTGGPEMEVKGQGAVLAEKKRKSKAY
jgi:hypothetical protein